MSVWGSWYKFTAWLGPAQQRKPFSCLRQKRSSYLHSSHEKTVAVTGEQEASLERPAGWTAPAALPFHGGVFPSTSHFPPSTTMSDGKGWTQVQDCFQKGDISVVSMQMGQSSGDWCPVWLVGQCRAESGVRGTARAKTKTHTLSISTCMCAYTETG